MKKLTNLENKLLNYLVNNESSFNGDEIDLAKEYNQQNWESENWNDFVDVKGYARELNLDTETVKGVLGNLVKNGLFKISEDETEDDYGRIKKFTWLICDEECFNNIKSLIK